jgi:hypothetical protein
LQRVATGRITVRLEAIGQNPVDRTRKGLEALGFNRAESNWGLYHRTCSKDRGPVILLAYVGDIVVAARSSEEIDEVKKGLSQRWKITDLGEKSTILSMKISRDRHARQV